MSRWKRLILGLVLAIGVVASVASGDSDSGGDASGSSDTAADSGVGGTKDAEKDVKIDSCTMSNDGFSGPKAALTVTNNSSKTSNYIITVAFEGPGGSQQLDTGNAAVNNLAPGQSASEEAVSFKKEANVEGMTCKVASVTRYASA